MDCKRRITAAKMVDELSAWIRNGGGILPLTGAGISVTAGIPAVAQLEAYLRHCVFLSVVDLVGLAGTKGFRGSPIVAWSPYGDPWPEMNVGKEELDWRNGNGESLRRQIDVLREAQRKDTRKDYWPLLKLAEQAVGACAGWTDSLLFLSRLQQCRTRDARKLVGSPQQWIVDAFVRQLVALKHPCLEHRMLAFLSDILRVRVSLTTNFDDLYEVASKDVGKDVTALDVHISAGLPSSNVVHNAGPVLLKLHGGRYGYRADFSLEEMPSNDDRREFASYLYGTPITPIQWENFNFAKTPLIQENSAIPRALLLLGVSGSDPRIMEMIKSAERALHRELPLEEKPPVFWVTFTEDQANRIAAQDELKDARLQVCREPYAGLLLLHLYQDLTGSLPTASPETPSMWRLATPPLIEPSNHPARLEDLQDIEDNIVKKGGVSYFRGPKTPIGSPFPDLVGLAATLYLQRLEKSEGCVWIELDEVANVDELFDRILESMAKRVGDERRVGTRASDTLDVGKSEPLPELFSRDKDRLLEIERLARRISNPWNIFLVGTEHFGKLTGFELNAQNEDLENKPEKLTVFKKLLELLTSSTEATIRVVLTGTSKVDLFRVREIRSGDINDVNIEAPRQHLKDYSPANRLSWDFLRFVRLHCKFDRSRYPASFCLWAAREQTGAQLTLDQNSADRFADKMVTLGWARRKSGGFLWLHPEAKYTLDSFFKCLLIPVSEPSDADCHQSIADWYWKVFVSSKTPSVLFDSIRHRLRCYESACENELRHRQTSALREISTSLQAAVQVLLSRGYTPGTCERLQKLKNYFAAFIEDPAKSSNHGEAQIIIGQVNDTLARLALEVVASQKAMLRVNELFNLPTLHLQSQSQLKKQAIRDLQPVLNKIWAGIKTRRNIEPEVEQVLTVQELLLAIETRKGMIEVPKFEAVTGEIFRKLLAREDVTQEMKTANQLLVLTEPNPHVPTAKMRPEGTETPIVKEYRDLGGEIGYCFRDDPAYLILLLRTYRRAMFSDLERAEMCRMIRSYTEKCSGATTDDEFKKHLTRALHTYHLSCEIARFLPMEYASQSVRERVQLKQLFGSVLSSLNHHTEAEKQFNESTALLECYGSIDPPREQLEAITKIQLAEAKLRRIYQTVEAFEQRFKAINLAWIRPLPAMAYDPPNIQAVAAARIKVLGMLRDIESILDSVKNMSFSTRKDHFWTSRFYYAAIRAQVFRCIMLADRGMEERLMESRGEGISSGITQIKFLLNEVRVLFGRTCLFSRVVAIRRGLRSGRSNADLWSRQPPPPTRPRGL